MPGPSSTPLLRILLLSFVFPRCVLSDTLVKKKEWKEDKDPDVCFPVNDALVNDLSAADTWEALKPPAFALDEEIAVC